MSDNRKVNTIEGNHRGDDHDRYAIVASRFNDFIVEPLIDGAIEALTENGVQEHAITLVRVPGAYELPNVARRLPSLASERHPFSAIIALGAIIRGDTPHFEYVARECARGLAQVSLGTPDGPAVPVAFGVLTVDTVEQAIARAAVRPDSSSAANKLKAGGEKQDGQQAPQSYGAGKSNKGYEAALAALEMASLHRRLSESALENVDSYGITT